MRAYVCACERMCYVRQAPWDLEKKNSKIFALFNTRENKKTFEQLIKITDVCYIALTSIHNIIYFPGMYVHVYLYDMLQVVCTRNVAL